MNDVTLVLKADNSQYVNKVKEAQQATQKLYDTEKKGEQDQKGYIQQQMDRLEKLTDLRKKSFDVNDIKIYNKAIEDAKKQLNELETAGVKVEKQTESMTQSIGKWVIGLGLATTVLNKLKEAFLQTTQGINLFNIAGAAMNQVLYNIVNGIGQWNQGVGQAIALQKQMNELRMKDYKETLKSKLLMQEYNKLYTEGIDQTITSEEKLKKLTEAKKKKVSRSSIYQVQQFHVLFTIN